MTAHSNDLTSNDHPLSHSTVMEAGGLMSRVSIRDGRYLTVGYIETDRLGGQWALSARFQAVGHFAPARNDTKGATYKVVAAGNVLSALIWDCAR